MIHLRSAQTRDAAFMKDLEAIVMADHAKSLWGAFVPADHISTYDLENTRIIQHRDQVIGYVTVERADDHLRLRKLYLAPGFQRRGIGKLVLDRVRDEAATAALPLRLSVLRPNEGAMRFYLRERLVPVEATRDRIFLQTPPGESRPDRPCDGSPPALY